MKFYGWVSDTARWLDDIKADYFLNTAIHEGMPYAVLEAMASGCPVVVSDIPENQEAVGDAGATFSVGNPDALRAVLAGVLQRPETARDLGVRGRARVVSVYNWDDIVRDTERVYLGLV